MNLKKIAKIIIPVLMISAIVGIWIVQTSQDNHVATADNVEFPLNVTSVDYIELAENNLPIIVDFGATECIPCKEMAPVLVTLNQEMQGKAIIQFVDVWETPEAANGYPIQVIPTQIFINSDGTPYIPSDDVAAVLSFSLYATQDTQEHVFTAHQGGLTEDQMRMILADMGVEE